MEIVLNQNKQIIISKLGIKVIIFTWYFLDTKCAILSKIAFTLLPSHENITLHRPFCEKLN